jgi:hypothetical protein
MQPLNSKSGRYLLVMLGGTSYSEIRSVYEVFQTMRERGRGIEILLVTTLIYNPIRFLELIGDLTME